MKRLIYFPVFFLASMSLINCGQNNSSAKIYDTIATDTIVEDVDISLYGIVLERSSANMLYITAYEDIDTFGIDLSGASLYGNIQTGDSVAVTLKSEYVAENVIDISDLCHKWTSSDTAGIENGYVNFSEDRKLDYKVGGQSLYVSWELMNGKLQLKKADKSKVDFMIKKLSNDSLIISSGNKIFRFGKAETSEI